jgi:SAM-dependent methyltransferase
MYLRWRVFVVLAEQLRMLANVPNSTPWRCIVSESNDWQVPGSASEIYETVMVPAVMGEWVPKGIALANPKPGENILDVACGTGVLTRQVAISIGPNGRAVGLDISPEMLAVALKSTLRRCQRISCSF